MGCMGLVTMEGDVVRCMGLVDMWPMTLVMLPLTPEVASP